MKVFHITRNEVLFPYNDVMATLDDVARSLGLSKRAVRTRIDALGDMLKEYLSRGERNRLIFRGEAVAILLRLEELRQLEGLPIRQAADRLRGELAAETEDAGIFIVIQPEEMTFLQATLREVYRERERWREYALALQSILPPELKWMTAASPPDSGDRRLN